MDRSPRVPAPWGLLGMLALVAATERYVARNVADFEVSYGCEWREAGHAAGHRAAKCDVLCFGDSLVKVGLAPRVLEHRLGRPTYNLALSAGQAPASYFLLRRALAAGARPAAVLVDFKWTALEAGPWLGARLLPEMATPAECLDLAWAARDARLFAALMVSEALPSARSRFEIRANLLAAFRGESTSARLRIQVSKRNARLNRGAHHAPRSTAFTGEVDVTDVSLFPGAWAPDPVNAAYVERFLALAAARGIPVFWLMMPISPAAQARREQIGADAAYTRFAGRMRDRFANLVVVDGRRAGYDRSVFVDPTHLDRQGAALLSDDVASLLAGRLGRRPEGPRGLELPAYRDRPIDVPLEDVYQSAIALQRGEAARR